MGFSLAGLLIAVAILAPNVLLAVFPPREGVASIVPAGAEFTVLERIGQVGCIALLCILPANFTRPPDAWLWLAAACVAAYYALWIRYLARGRSLRLLFAPVLRVPVPMALLPVAAFALVAVWGQSVWLALAVAALAVGHIANSWASYRALPRS